MGFYDNSLSLLNLVSVSVKSRVIWETRYIHILIDCKGLWQGVSVGLFKAFGREGMLCC